MATDSNIEWTEFTSNPVTGVAFFFKQWGGVRKELAGRALDGRTYNEMPARAVDAQRMPALE
jgi:protein gp37